MSEGEKIIIGLEGGLRMQVTVHPTERKTVEALAYIIRKVEEISSQLDEN